MKRKKFRLKKSVEKKLKIIGVVLIIIIGIFIFYQVQISSLTKLGYSKEAARNILFQFKKEYVLTVGENKTLNAAFMSSDYNEKYLD